MADYDERAMSRLPGGLLEGRYYVEEYLGSSGECDLFRGFDDVLSQQVVIKALKDEHVGDPEAIDRLRLESLSHRCEGRRVLDTGGDADRFFVVLGEEISQDQADREHQAMEQPREAREREAPAPLEKTPWACRVDRCKGGGSKSFPLMMSSGWMRTYLCPKHWTEYRARAFEERRQEGRATRSRWKTTAMARSVELPLPSRVWTPAEWEVIRYGFIPIAMEYKWFLYVEDMTLHVHRSWTGYEVYRARFAENANGFMIIELAMNGEFYGKRAADQSWDPAEATHTLVTTIIDEQVLLL